MTFGDSMMFLFMMLLASVVVAAAIFAGAMAVSFMSGARPIVDAPADPETKEG
jgi:hypothetical protein